MSDDDAGSKSGRFMSDRLKALLEIYERERASGIQEDVTRAVGYLVKEGWLCPDDFEVLAEIAKWHREHGGCDSSVLDALEARVEKHRAEQDREPNYSECR